MLRDAIPIISFAQAQQLPEASVISAIQQEKQQKGRYEIDSLNKLKQLWANFPASRDVFILLHQALVEFEDWDSVVRLHRSAPAFAEPAIIAKSLYRLGRYAEAAQELRFLLAKQPENKGLQLLLAQSLYFLGEYQESARLLDVLQLETLQERSRDAFWIRGMLYMDAKDYEKAADFFHKSLELDPSFAGAHSALARVLFLQGKTEAAQKQFEYVRQMTGQKNQEKQLGYRKSATIKMFKEAWQEARYDDARRLLAQLEVFEDPSLREVLDRYREALQSLP